MPGALYDVVGIAGVSLIVVAYLLLQSDRLQAADRRYSFANALGASLVLVSLVHDFNLSAFLIEAFWLAISLYGLWRPRSRPRAEA